MRGRSVEPLVVTALTLAIALLWALATRDMAPDVFSAKAEKILPLIAQVSATLTGLLLVAFAYLRDRLPGPGEPGAWVLPTLLITGISISLVSIYVLFFLPPSNYETETWALVVTLFSMFTVYLLLLVQFIAQGFGVMRQFGMR